MISASQLRIDNKTNFTLHRIDKGSSDMTWFFSKIILGGQFMLFPVNFNKAPANGFVEYQLEGGLFRILADNSGGPRMSVVNESVASSSLRPTEVESIAWKEGGVMTLTIKAKEDGSGDFSFVVKH